jgi:hypothetical protein
MMRSFSSLLLAGTLLFGTVSSFSNNSTYYLNSYSVGSGSSTNFSNGTYSGQASLGETAASNPVNGTSNVNEAGGVQTEQLAIPQAPTLNNGSGTYYNKLGFTLNDSMGNSTYPTDVTFSVEVANTSSFTSPSYVQTGGVLGSSPFFQSYASWGGSGGSTITNLTPGLTYYVKVSAKQGEFTNTAYGPSQNATLTNPSVAFSVSPSSVSLGSLLSGAVETSSNITVGLTTNADFGGNIFVSGTSNAGLHSPSQGYTIGALTGNLASSSEGFGLQGNSATQSSGGPLTIESPYNGSSNNVGAESSSYAQIFSAANAIVSGSATLDLQAKSSTSDPGGTDYAETLSFVAAASF